ncbi:hypothetical protein [Mesobacillus foraminis]|uniref:hypothetical protein n=1 Tax=Mesobacillus foraminis TaxID=279826 RepID=UPI0013CF0B5A|nr:hypothetical protein [Mesobacillus foraminis]
MSVIVGVLSLVTFFCAPLAVIFLLIWIYQMKRNSQIQVEQNIRIIELLEFEKKSV